LIVAAVSKAVHRSNYRTALVAGQWMLYVDTAGHAAEFGF